MLTRIATWTGAAALAVGALAACGTATDSPQPPATVTRVPGTTVDRLRLTPEATRRLGIATVAVGEADVAVEGKKGPHEVIPYAAVVYDTDGSTWTYVSPAPGTYQRAPITVADIQGDVAVLNAGPPAGTQVVTVGAPELLGIEYNISGEQ